MTKNHLIKRYFLLKPNELIPANHDECPSFTNLERTCSLRCALKRLVVPIWYPFKNRVKLIYTS